MSDHKAVHYRRTLPGGGFVAVESDEQPSAPRAWLRVERRASRDRRDGHEPPVVATAEGATFEQALEELYAIAHDNVAVAQSLLRWQAERGGGRRRDG
jgi:hypothetical protein